MSSSIPPNLGFGSFIPTTFVWELEQIRSSNIDPNLKDILIRLYQNLNQIVLPINTKDSAIYDLSEFVNGQIFFSNPALTSLTSQSPTPRQVFRKVFNFGALPNAATKSVAHGITIDANLSITRFYGAATDPSTSYIPIPFASTVAVANNIELTMDATNINVITAANYSAYTTCYIVVEYLKQ